MGLNVTRRRWDIRLLRAMAVAIVVLMIGPQVAAATDASKRIYIRNRTDRPLRIYFTQAKPKKCFCVLRVNEGDNALIENVPQGNWDAAIIELLQLRSVGNPTASLPLGASDPNCELFIGGTVDAGYVTRVIRDVPF